MPTLKHLAVPIGFTRHQVNVMASGARLARVARIDENNLDSRNSGFIGRELPQLIESPPMDLGSRFLPDLRSESNPCQVLESKRRVCFHSFFNQLFRDVVVNPRLKPRFLPREPSQEPFRSLGAFGLNRGSGTDETVTGFSQLIPVPRFPRTGRGDVPNSEVNADYFRCLPFGLFGDLHDDVDIVVSLSGLTEGRTRGFLPLQQPDLVSPDGEVKSNPSAFQCYSDLLFLFSILAHCEHRERWN